MMRRLIAVLTVVLLVATPAVAADPVAEAALSDFNKAARAAYAAGRTQMLARTDPVVLVAFETLILRRNGQETKVDFTPPGYHRLKSVAHMALGLYGALAPVTSADDSWKVTVADLRAKALAVRGVLDRLDFTPAQADRQRELIDLSVAFIDRTRQRVAWTRRRWPASAGRLPR
jgi:hypothetical protein